MAMAKSYPPLNQYRHSLKKVLQALLSIEIPEEQSIFPDERSDATYRLLGPSGEVYQMRIRAHQPVVIFDLTNSDKTEYIRTNRLVNSALARCPTPDRAWDAYDRYQAGVYVDPAVTFNEAFTLLVAHADANHDDRKGFLDNFLKPERERSCEWRFCGSLGFGGKFWSNAGSLYVSFYPEDTTHMRRLIGAMVNMHLACLPPCR